MDKSFIPRYHTLFTTSNLRSAPLKGTVRNLLVGGFAVLYVLDDMASQISVIPTVSREANVA